MNLQDINFEKLLQKSAIAGIVVISIALILFIGDSLFRGIFDFKIVLDTEKFDHFGSFVGGSAGLLFTIATTILVYLTYQTQKAELEQARKEAKASRKALQMQAKTNQIQQFENTFFNLLNNHREVLNSLQETWTKGETIEDERVFKGREVIDVVVNFIKAVSYKGLHYSRDKPFHAPFEQSFTKFTNYIPIVSSKYNLAFLIKTFQLKTEHGKGVYLSDLKTPEGLSDIYFEVFIQNRSSLGHYFRNLFHLVKFIDGYTGFEPFYPIEICDIEVFKLKYNYVRLVRAQLSNNELILLALNSITEFGEDFIPLIEKYKLLKNTNLVYELGGMEGLIDCYPHFLQPE